MSFLNAVQASHDKSLFIGFYFFGGSKNPASAWAVMSRGSGKD
jgi:hypothetical protein